MHRFSFRHQYVIHRGRLRFIRIRCLGIAEQGVEVVGTREVEARGRLFGHLELVPARC
jgi:hypothetical protein